MFSYFGFDAPSPRPFSRLLLGEGVVHLHCHDCLEYSCSCVYWIFGIFPYDLYEKRRDDGGVLGKEGVCVEACGDLFPFAWLTVVVFSLLAQSHRLYVRASFCVW